MLKITRWSAVAATAFAFAACSDSPTQLDLTQPSQTLATVVSGEQVDLIAGQNTVVGYVEVTGSDPITVRYVITDPDWCLTETHVAIADEASGLPTNRGGNPMIGRFPYGESDLGCISEWSVDIDADDIEDTDADDELVVAAHAVVQKCEGGGDGTQFLYGIEDVAGNGDGDIYRVDPSTGTAALIYDFAADPSANVFSPNGLAFDDGSEVLYFSVDPDGDPFTGTDDLYSFDVNTMAAPTPVGDLEHTRVYSASFYADAYYYIPNATDNLYAVTFDGMGGILSTTEVCTDVVDGVSDASLQFGDIAIASDGTLFGWARDGNPGADYYYFQLDVDDCSGKTSANVTDLHGTEINLQLALGEDGTLYGHQAVSALGSDAGQWYTVDKDTGVITNLFVTSPSFTDISAGFVEGSELICEGEETAWAEGTGFPGRNWAMYFTYSPPTS